MSYPVFYSYAVPVRDRELYPAVCCNLFCVGFTASIYNISTKKDFRCHQG